MDSRIILTQADFSANNIGRYVEMLDLTKKVLAKQTQYDVESEQAIALNIFLTTLTEGGYIGGTDPLLKYLIVPALAANHDQLLYNIAELDENGYPVDKMSDAEKSAETKVFLTYGTDKVNGLTFNGSSSITQTMWDDAQEQHIPGLLTKNAAYPSLSICAFFDHVGASSVKNLVRIGSGYTVRLHKENFGIWSDSVSANYIKAGVTTSVGAGFVGMGYDSSDNSIISLLDTGAVSSTVDKANVGSVKTANTGFYDALAFDQFTYTQSKVKIPFCCVGKLMTSSQMNSLRTAVSTLLASLNG